EWAGDSDRAAIMVFQAGLDRHLERLLRRHFHAVSGGGRSPIDELLTRQPFPPLGSFQVRAKMAKLLGLIDPTSCAALCNLAALRNKYAHKEIPPKLTVA